MFSPGAFPSAHGGGGGREWVPPRRLSPRMLQTLELLLGGDAEKEVAYKLGVSPHTVHVYVKALYRSFGVNSRAELLAAVFAAVAADRHLGQQVEIDPPDAELVISGC